MMPRGCCGQAGDALWAMPRGWCGQAGDALWAMPRGCCGLAGDALWAMPPVELSHKFAHNFMLLRPTKERIHKDSVRQEARYLESVVRMPSKSLISIVSGNPASAWA